MAGFDDLIPACMPYMATDEVDGTAGADWQWEYTVDDNAGDPIPWTTGYTGTCKIKNARGDTIASPDVSFPASGIVRCVLGHVDTATLPKGKYLWELKVTRTSGGAPVVLIGGGDSHFTIKPSVSA